MVPNKILLAAQLLLYISTLICGFIPSVAFVWTILQLCFISVSVLLKIIRSLK